MMDVLIIDSDNEVYTDTSDSEDQDSESAFGGHAQSILSSLDESIGKIDDFLAFERGYLHGDVVCSATDPSGQLGRVVDVDMIVDLETFSGDILRDVNSRKLSRVRSFICGDYVVMGPWIGRVIKAFDVVTVVFNDGAKCEILVRDTEILKPLPPNLLEDAPYCYYPGLRVRTNIPTFAKSARWLCGSWRASRDEGIVCHVDVGLVHVNWITSVMNVCGIHSSTPPHFLEPKSLTLLSCFPYANWQLGDWCTLSVDCFRNLWLVAEKSATWNAAPKCCGKMLKGCELHDHDCKQTFVIVKMKSKVDVLWQNGKFSIGLDPQTLIPVSNLGDHDFWPEQFVLEKVAPSSDVCASKCQRIGVVKKVDAQERTVTVKWVVPGLDQAVGFTGHSSEETVSAYELVEHQDYSYCIGEVVLRSVAKLDKMEERLHSVNLSQHREGHDLLLDVLHSSLVGKSALQMMVTNGNDDAFHAFLSCVGNVIGYKNDLVEVKWANGLISKAEPSEIYGLDRFHDTTSLPLVNEEAVVPSDGMDMAVQENGVCHEIAKKALDDYCDDCVGSSQKATASLFPWAAFNFLTNVAASLFGTRGSTSSGSVGQSSKYQILKTAELISNADNMQHCYRSVLEDHNYQVLKTAELQSNMDDLQGVHVTLQKVVEQSEKPTLFPENNRPGKFKQFDVVNECSDHHFMNEMTSENAVSQARRCLLKKIQQEWNILQNDLPESIYVRVCEEHVNLLRACIVGADGTPYHDGLFFFDIFLPPDYPHEPPLVHYHSGGLRLNPNLYESGKVCLSLLKTWTGTGTEVWNPESSTVLQVLLSLQGLVLNEKPYFNEAGYDKQIGRAEGEKNSITYNENAFLLSCKSMIYLLHKPPKHFERLVEEHFTHRSAHFLLACKAYLDGAQVGHAHDNGKVPGEDHKSCSTGFKIMLAKLLPKLLSAFCENGIDCGEFASEVGLVEHSGKDDSL